ARRSLCADHLPVALAAVVEGKVAAWSALRVGELRSLRQHFASVPDFRGRVESYPLSSALAMVACAHLCGAPRGHRDLKAFGRRFTQPQLRALGVRQNLKNGRYPSPSKATFGRVLRAVDPLRVEAALLDWQTQVRGPAPQQETGRQIVQEAGADFLLTVKANQKELRQTLAKRLPNSEQLFSPSTTPA